MTLCSGFFFHFLTIAFLAATFTVFTDAVPSGTNDSTPVSFLMTYNLQWVGPPREVDQLLYTIVTLCRVYTFQPPLAWFIRIATDPTEMPKSLAVSGRLDGERPDGPFLHANSIQAGQAIVALWLIGGYLSSASTTRGTLLHDFEANLFEVRLSETSRLAGKLFIEEEAAAHKGDIVDHLNPALSTHSNAILTPPNKTAPLTHPQNYIRCKTMFRNYGESLSVGSSYFAIIDAMYSLLQVDQYAQLKTWYSAWHRTGSPWYLSKISCAALGEKRKFSKNDVAFALDNMAAYMLDRIKIAETDTECFVGTSVDAFLRVELRSQTRPESSIQ